MRASAFIRFAIAPCLCLLLALPMQGCSDQRQTTPPPPKPATPVSICMGGALSILPIIAQYQQFDAQEGLAITNRQLKDGKTALDAAMSGECDLATIAEPPIVQRGFSHDDFAILAALMVSDNASKILARADLGIQRGSDLRGRRLGARKHTLSHFFLAIYLQRHGISSDNVEIRFLDSKDLPLALERGEIDAYASADAYIIEGKRRMGDKALVLSEPGLCYNGSYLCTSTTWLTANPDASRRLLASLLRAEKFLNQHPDQAKDLVVRHAGIPMEELETILRDARFSVSLPQPLLLSFEDQARWQMHTGQTTGQSLPNALNFFRPEILRSLKPEAVTMGK